MDSEVAHGKVVDEWILGADAPEIQGDLASHPPVRPSPGAEPETRPDPRPVRIERNDEMGRIDQAGPEAEVDPIVRPDHPAEEEAQPLAGRGTSGVGEEEVQASLGSRAPRRGRTIVRVGPRGARCGIDRAPCPHSEVSHPEGEAVLGVAGVPDARGESGAKASLLHPDLPYGFEQTLDIPPIGPAVAEPRSPVGFAMPSGTEGCGGPGAPIREDGTNAVSNRRNPAVGQ